MADPTGDDWISVPSAGRLLGLELHTVRRLIETGELGGVDVSGLTQSGQPRRRRSFRLTRQDVDDYIERSRLKPGALRKLHPEWAWDRYQDGPG